jgi:hypothetical protein
VKAPLGILLLAGVAACLPQARLTPSAERTTGEFAYQIEAKPHDPITGVFAVLPDSVVITPSRESCWPSREASGHGPRAFECQPRGVMKSLVIYIDEKRPAWSTWRASQVVVRRRNVCAGSLFNDVTGKSECARYREETYFADSTFGGRLTVRQVNSGP